MNEQHDKDFSLMPNIHHHKSWTDYEKTGRLAHIGDSVILSYCGEHINLALSNTGVASNIKDVCGPFQAVMCVLAHVQGLLGQLHGTEHR